MTLRRHAEEALRESEHRYRMLFESMDQGCCIIEMIFDDSRTKAVNWRYLEANPAFEKQSGLRDAVGKTIVELVPGIERKWLELYGQVALTGEPVRFENQVESLDGIWVDLYAFRFGGAESRKVAVLFTNTTVRRRAEAKLQESEARFRRLFEASKDGILLLDPASGKITDANPFMTGLLDYRRDELLGRQLFEIGLLKDAAASREMVRKLQRNQPIRYEDLPLLNRSGGRQDVEVVASLYRENGHSVIQCNLRDITQRKRAMEVLIRSEALFSTLIAEAPVGILVVDGDFRFQEVNRAGRPVFKNVESLIGRDMAQIFRILWAKPVAAKLTRIFRRTLATGESYRSPPFHERRRDIGKVQNYDWQIQRVTLPSGAHRCVCFFSNSTLRVRAEAARRRLAAMTASNEKLRKEIVRRQAVEQALKRSERGAQELLRQSRLLQGKLRQVSHQTINAQEELRKEISRELHDEVSQLLVGINVHLTVFTEAVAVDPLGIRRRVVPLRQKVAGAIRKVHAFSRELRPSTLDDLGLIPALRSYIDEFAAQKGPTIAFKAFAGVEALGIEQRTALYRVAQEALVNIRKHSRANAAGIVIRRIPGGACMEITDNGKAFDVARLSSPRWSRRLGMTGMRERVEMVGGRFGVVSVIGTGTTVRAEIPFDQDKLRDSVR